MARYGKWAIRLASGKGELAAESKGYSNDISVPAILIRIDRRTGRIPAPSCRKSLLRKLLTFPDCINPLNV